MRMLVVDPAARGRGIGRTLIATCLERARAGGRSGLVLSTQAEMTVAHALYESVGFVRRPERDWSPHAGLTLMAYDLAL